jgi:hypothetical protein
LEFDFYQIVSYWDDGGFPQGKSKLGRWVGVADRIGQALCYSILAATGAVVYRSTVQPIPREEQCTPAFKARAAALDKGIQEKIGDAAPNGADVAEDIGILVDGTEGEDEGDDTLPYEPEATMPEADDFEEEGLDNYITAQVMLPKGKGMQRATVTGRKRDANGNPIGVSNKNPILDTRMYEVEFDDGSVQEYAANLIADNVYAQVDDEGN